MPVTHNCDVAIVGGGLAGGLIALALTRKRPDCTIRLIEGSRRIGGNHLWSFFASDVAAEHRWLIAPLISYGWTGYDVAFPGHARTLKNPYYSIESERLDQLVRETLPRDALMLKRKVLATSAKAVVLADGDRVEAQGVIDCRGPADLSMLDLGWQKFLGREFRLSDGHDVPRPLVMDATVEQRDGYRFVYCLPFAATRMFVEDTYYSDDRHLDADLLGARIDEYVAASGWQVDRVAREEGGVLPVVMGGDFEEYWRAGGNRVAKAGMRAGLFHPVTGYSLPDALRAAAAVADASDVSGVALHDLLHGLARKSWRSRGFYRTLSAMLFRAAEPAERWRILERFYRLDAGLIARFYAGQSSVADRLRVLSGKPPVPIGKAVKAIRGKKR
ncbi:lycopene beta-cyclase CrtY [Stakelama tenebrarum]|uniref:Lycopene beta-cyclase CrtY n=1 Tax=Stakelama tenebrarum TaxID=2711215 RepID=A0A6G6Y277_9SPHN|nr:lycopene beta-cyclase CrtY [Sphingosinithalassobacter tenebrarum]QIG78676.1 lycopene beta-cyclase CrtY [Sphingosinithalassobacter tenebrarum]